MSNETKETITTLKAEAVNEVIILKKGVSYPSDFKCEIAVKVGNKVENVIFEYGRDYYSENRQPCAHLTKSSKAKFSSLEEAGIAIDFTPVKALYLLAIDKCKVIIEEEKQIAIKKGIEKRIEFYDNKSWVKDFIANVKGDKRFANKKFSFSKMDRDEYINGTSSLHLKLTYNGVVGYFKNSEFTTFPRDSFRSNTQVSFNVTDGFSKKDNQSMSITDGKTRKGKLPKSVVHRWFQDVDEYLAIQKSRVARKTKEEKDRKDYIKMLEKNSGHKVEAKNEYRWREERQGGSYYVWNYFINIPVIGEEKERELKIAYNSYHKTFSVNGLNGLNDFQFKSVIEILGKKIQ